MHSAQLGLPLTTPMIISSLGFADQDAILQIQIGGLVNGLALCPRIYLLPAVHPGKPADRRRFQCLALDVLRGLPLYLLRRSGGGTSGLSGQACLG